MYDSYEIVIGNHDWNFPVTVYANGLVVGRFDSEEAACNYIYETRHGMTAKEFLCSNNHKITVTRIQNARSSGNRFDVGRDALIAHMEQMKTGVYKWGL